MKNHAGLIKHNIVALYTHPSERKSVVKFGSYDPTGLVVGQSLNMLKTVDKTTWALDVKQFEIIGYDSAGSSEIITNQVHKLDGLRVFLEP